MYGKAAHADKNERGSGGKLSCAFQVDSPCPAAAPGRPGTGEVRKSQSLPMSDEINGECNVPRCRGLWQWEGGHDGRDAAVLEGRGGDKTGNMRDRA